MKTPTLPPATHTNAVLVRGRQGNLLIEPASADPIECERLAAWATHLLAGQALTHLAITHHHADHVGGLRWATERFGLEVCCHPLTARRLGLESFIPLQEADTVDLGSVKVTAVHTPGHAPGHLCFLVDDGNSEGPTLVVGDMVASVGTILVEPVDGDMTLYLESLARMIGLGARVAIPAHGDPIDKPHRLFEYYILHRRKREEKVLAVLREMPDAATPESLVSRVYDDAPREVWPLAAGVVHAHLIKLAREGRAVERTAGALVRYSVAR